MKCKGDQSGRFVHGFRGQTALAQLTASALFYKSGCFVTQVSETIISNGVADSNLVIWMECGEQFTYHS